MKHLTTLFWLFGIAFLLFSCEGAMNYSPTDISEESAGHYDALAEAGGDGSESVLSKGRAAEEGDYAANTLDFSEKPEVKSELPLDKSKIIRNAWLQLELKNYDEHKKGIFETTDRFGAFVSNENEERNASQIRNTMEIKVSSANFDSLLLALEHIEGVVHVDSKRSNSEDVGEEYYDIEARIKAKREVELRYLDILSKARTIKDVLSVEEQLRIIREEIEARQGRLNYLKDRIARSTIYLTVYQNLDYTAVVADRPGFFNKLSMAFRGGWNGILNGLVALGYLWPIWILFIVAIFLWRRRRARRRSLSH